MGDKADWNLRFIWLLVFISSMVLCSYYIVNNINSCTSQPLEYAVKQVKDKFDIEYAYGTMTIIGKNNAFDILSFGDANITNSNFNNISLQIP